VSTAPIDPDYVGQREPIHHARIFGFDAPTTCGKVDQPKPAALEWRYVTCPRCLALVVHARQAPDTTALCGAEAGEGQSTARRSEVTCGPCCVEIGRRRLR
jgi:hypothetical protein